MSEKENTKILIVDDSKFMREVLRDILKRNGYENIVETDNGEDAISSYESENPDVVFLDLILPKVDGLDVLANIVPKGAKVIVVSIVSVEEIIEKARSSGAQEYIVKSQGHVGKPFDEEKVLALLNKALES